MLRIPFWWRRISFIAPLLVASVFAQQAIPGSPVVITVTDASGAAISHAKIRIVPTPEMAPKMESDAEGRLALNLRSGGYSLFAEHSGFSTYVTHLDVSDSKQVQNVPVVLQADASSPVEIVGAASGGKNVLSVNAPSYHVPIHLSDSELRRYPPTSVIYHNPQTNMDENYSGVRLSDLLSNLGVPLGDKLHGEALANYIVAERGDGYRVVLSLAEVDPSFHHGEIIVADSMNGKPLDEHSGPFKLVVTEDFLPERSLRNLVAIELEAAP